MSEELKPCPFCGGAVKMARHKGSDETGERWDYLSVECRSKDHNVICDSGDTAEEVAAAWNRRAPMTALTTPPAGEEGETLHELAQRVVAAYEANGMGNSPILELVLARAVLSSPRVEEVRRMREALRQLELNESELWGIRDDYIEAQHSGVYNGKRIKPEAARQYARDFGERADSAKQCADIVRAALSPQGG